MIQTRIYFFALVALLAVFIFRECTRPDPPPSAIQSQAEDSLKILKPMLAVAHAKAERLEKAFSDYVAKTKASDKADSVALQRTKKTVAYYKSQAERVRQDTAKLVPAQDSVIRAQDDHIAQLEEVVKKRTAERDSTAAAGFRTIDAKNAEIEVKSAMMDNLNKIVVQQQKDIRKARNGGKVWKFIAGAAVIWAAKESIFD